MSTTRAQAGRRHPTTGSVQGAWAQQPGWTGLGGLGVKAAEVEAEVQGPALRQRGTFDSTYVIHQVLSGLQLHIDLPHATCKGKKKVSMRSVPNPQVPCTLSRLSCSPSSLQTCSCLPSDLWCMLANRVGMAVMPDACCIGPFIWLDPDGSTLPSAMGAVS